MPALVLGADGLCRVFYHGEPVGRRHFHDGAHLGRLAVQVHRDDRPRPPCHRRRQLGGVDVERNGVDIREDGLRAEPGDRPGRGEERVGGGDDLVARLDVQRHERDEQGVRAGRHADRVAAPAVCGDGLLERLHLRAQDELLRLQHAVDGLAELVAQRRVLRLEVQQRHLETSSHGPRHRPSSSPSGASRHRRTVGETCRYRQPLSGHTITPSATGAPRRRPWRLIQPFRLAGTPSTSA